MNVLLAGPDSPLRSALEQALANDNDLTILEATSLVDRDAVWSAARGKHAVLHTGQLAGDDETKQLDYATRGLQILFAAAVDAGAKRLVLGSTLSVFESYPDDVYITEHWRPDPTEDMAQMAPYLSERIATEFAREHAVSVTVLRLGHLVTDADVGASAPDFDWLHIEDATAAFAHALQRDASSQVNWVRRLSIHHIVADHPNPKFLRDASRIVGNQPLGFIPTHNFKKD